MFPSGPRLNPHLRECELAFPFIGVSELERRRGRPYRLRLGANECLFGPSAAAQARQAESAAQASLYCDPHCYELRNAISERYGVAFEQVLVGDGIEGLLNMFFRALVAKGDCVVSLRGSYPSVPFYVESCQGQMVFVDYLEGGVADVEGLIAAARDTNAKVLYLATPDNPSGRQISADELGRVLRQLPDDCVLLLDEAYAEYADQEQLLPADFHDPRVVRLRTFSKAYALAGIRVGYAIADATWQRALHPVRQHFAVSSASEAMALAAFQDHDHLAFVEQATAAGRADYAALFESAGMVPIPSTTNFVTVDCGTTAISEQLQDWFEQHDVLILRPNAPPFDTCLRVTVGPPSLREDFAREFHTALAEIPMPSKP